MPSLSLYSLPKKTENHPTSSGVSLNWKITINLLITKWRSKHLEISKIILKESGKTT